MRVLWITDYFNPENNDGLIGGVEARCYYVFKNLATKIKLTVLARDFNKWTPAGFKTLFERLFFTVRVIFNGLRIDFDLVEGTNFATYFPAVVLGSIKRKKIIFWYADVFLGEWIKNIGLVGIIGEIVERVLLKIPNVIYIAISNQTKFKLIKAGVKPQNIFVVGCGFDEKEVEAVLSQKISKKFDIVCVSRLVKYKRIDDLVRAVSQLPKFKLTIVGEGPEKSSLIKLVEQLGASDRVKFFGRIEKHNEVLKIMVSGKIFCLPSMVEGFGIVIIEAAALGVPYVASNLDVIKEITKNSTGGLLFEKLNIADLTDKIELLLSDKKLQKRLSGDGMVMSSKYTWQAIADQTLSVYKKITI